MAFRMELWMKLLFLLFGLSHETILTTAFTFRKICTTGKYIDSRQSSSYLSLFPPSSSSTTRKVGTIQAGPIEISQLGCGTWSWGNRLLWNYDPSQDEEIYSAYRAVRNGGITIFDTADSYGTFDLNGRAELLLGQFERRYLLEQQQQNTFWSKQSPPQRQRQQQVATKFAPYPWRITRSSMVNAARASLQRLNNNNNNENNNNNNNNNIAPIEKLSIAQLHWSTSNYQPLQERALWEGIADVYDAGLCESVGVSNYGPKQLYKFSNRMKERSIPIASAQIQYSLMTINVAKEMNDACDDVNCRLIAYSPLCLGLLTGKYMLGDKEILPPVGNPRRQLFKELLPGAKPLLDTLGVISEDVSKTQSQVAINWALCKGTVPIPGARTLKQAEENLGAVGWSLSQDAIEELDFAASKVSKPMIQNIFQTK